MMTDSLYWLSVSMMLHLFQTRKLKLKQDANKEKTGKYAAKAGIETSCRSQNKSYLTARLLHL